MADAELPSDRASLATRYREVHLAAQPLFAPPAQREILGKLIWPLRHAQNSYVLGNYLGTISLCGFVAEDAGDPARGRRRIRAGYTHSAYFGPGVLHWK